MNSIPKFKKMIVSMTAGTGYCDLSPQNFAEVLGRKCLIELENYMVEGFVPSTSGQSAGLLLASNDCPMTESVASWTSGNPTNILFSFPNNKDNTNTTTLCPSGGDNQKVICTFPSTSRMNFVLYKPDGTTLATTGFTRVVAFLRITPVD